MNKCPMTNENVTLYSLTDNQVKVFCNKGCSVLCEEEFEKKFKIKNKEEK